VKALTDRMDYSRFDTSFSPWFSDVGLGFVDRPGIDCLRFHYNRRTRTVGQPLIGLDGEAKASRTALRVDQRIGEALFSVAFYGHNSWLLQAAGSGPVRLDLTGEAVEEHWREDDGEIRLFLAYIEAADPRDPDGRYPILLALRTIEGSVKGLADSGLAIEPSPEGRVLAAMTAAACRIDRTEAVRKLRAAPDSVDLAAAQTEGWLEQTLGGLRIEAEEEAEARVLATAAYTLAANSALAPGNLSGRIASFPSRGGYPTHFLWDSCFHLLALEDMDPRLAEDAMLLLTENLRADGKMAHFLCSTWMRPHESQPPLVGWAGLRLARKRRSASLAAQLLPALQRNNRWWLSYRMTRRGLICCRNPLETGWDDTPRLDRGPILALDMNSYLLMQIRACADLARMTGDRAAAEGHDAQADRYAGRMKELLYDPQANLFRDVLLATGEKLAIVTPACFLPLLAGVPIPEAKARGMIEDVLLSPEKLFGPCPFPCVAYDEPSYQPEKWWRGPTWMPVAYFMLEILDRYGYRAERREAARRLYRMIVDDGYVSELYNSQTGEGLGRRQQGWTAAILFALRRIVRGEE
jgi:hypothetical protein